MLPELNQTRIAESPFKRISILDGALLVHYIESWVRHLLTIGTDIQPHSEMMNGTIRRVSASWSQA